MRSYSDKKKPSHVPNSNNTQKIPKKQSQQGDGNAKDSLGDYGNVQTTQLVALDEKLNDSPKVKQLQTLQAKLNSDKSAFPKREQGVKPAKTEQSEGTAPVQMQAIDVSYARVISDGPYGWTAAYDVNVNDDAVTISVKVKMVRDADVTEAEQQTVESVTRNEFMRYFDQRFNLVDDSGNSRRLQVNLEYVDNGEHLTVSLHSGAGRDNLVSWHVESEPIVRAHEMGHQLGLLDEYVDPSVPSRATAASPGVTSDSSLMGNFYTQGIDNADVRMRHGETFATDLSAATGMNLSAEWSSTYVVRRGDTLDKIAQRIYGDASKSQDIYDLNRDMIASPNAINPGDILHLPPR